MKSGVKGKNILVLSPYRAQCTELQKKMKIEKDYVDVSVMTVVAAQGKT